MPPVADGPERAAYPQAKSIRRSFDSRGVWASTTPTP